MNIAFNILEEELQRLKLLAQKYNREINKLPQGALSLKKRYNKSFAYLAFRVNDKVKFKYLGNPDSLKVAAIREKLEQKKQYQNKLKNVLNAIKDISRIVHARKNRSIQ